MKKGIGMTRKTLLIAAALASVSLSGYPSFDAGSFSAVGIVAAAESPAAVRHTNRDLAQKVRDLEKAQDFAGLAALDAQELANPSFVGSRLNFTQIPGYKARLALASGDAARLSEVVDMIAQETRQNYSIRKNLPKVFEELRAANPEAASAALERVGLAGLGETPGGRDVHGILLSQSCAMKYEFLAGQALESQDGETLKELVRQMSSEKSTPQFHTQIAETLKKIRKQTENTPLGAEIDDIIRQAQHGQFLNKEACELSSQIGAAISANDKEKVQELTAQMRALLPELKTTGDVGSVVVFASTLRLSYPRRADGLELLVDLGQEFASLETPNKYLLLDSVAQALVSQLPGYLRAFDATNGSDKEEAKEKLDAILNYGKENVCFAIRFSEISSALKTSYPQGAAFAIRAERDALIGLNALSATERERLDAAVSTLESSNVEKETNEAYAAMFAKLASTPENASGAVLLERKHALENGRRRLAALVPPTSGQESADVKEKWEEERRAAFDAYKLAAKALDTQILFNTEIEEGQRVRAALQLASGYQDEGNLEALDKLLERAKAENLSVRLLSYIETSHYGVRLDRAYQAAASDASSDAALTAIIAEGIEKSRSDYTLRAMLLGVSGKQPGEKNAALALEILDRLIAAEEERAAENAKDANVNPGNDWGLSSLKGTRYTRLMKRALDTPERDGLDAIAAEFAAEAKASVVVGEYAYRLYEELWSRPKEEGLRRYALQLGEASIGAFDRIASASSGSQQGAKRLSAAMLSKLMSRKALMTREAGDDDAYQTLLRK